MKQLLRVWQAEIPKAVRLNETFKINSGFMGNMLAFQKEYITVEDGDYQEALMTAMNRISKGKLARVVRSAAEADLDLQYLLVARLVPLSMDDTVVLVEDAVDWICCGSEVLDADAQGRLAMITCALVERATDYVDEGSLFAASSVCFAVVRAVEPLVLRVVGDRALLLRLGSDAFDVLRELVMEPGAKEEFSLILLLAESELREARSRGKVIYLAEWEGVIEGLKKHLERV